MVLFEKLIIGSAKMETTIPERIERSIYAAPYSGRFQTTTVSGRFLACNFWLLTVARQPGIYTRFPFHHG